MENEHEKRSFAALRMTGETLRKAGARGVVNPDLVSADAQDDRKGVEIPEFIGTERLIKASAMLTETGEEQMRESFRAAMEGNDGEVFPALVDFLSAAFLE